MAVSGLMNMAWAAVESPKDAVPSTIFGSGARTSAGVMLQTFVDERILRV